MDLKILPELFLEDSFFLKRNIMTGIHTAEIAVLHTENTHVNTNANIKKAYFALVRSQSPD